jgi:hypothetical protein
MSSPTPGAVVPIRPTTRAPGDPSLDGGNGGPHPPDMSDISGRVSKIEGAVDGLKSAVDAMRWVIGLGFPILAVIMIGGFTFLGFQITQTNNRVITLESKVDSLPDKISTNLLNLTKTLSDAITASKQQPPQVILMPAPMPAPQPSPPPLSQPAPQK